jgi:septum formation protein
MRRIVLASGSPRRRALLEQIGLKFEVEPSEFPENPSKKLSPSALVKHLSQEKAKAVAPKFPDALIIAADTIGVIHGRTIGKPEDADGARKMLNLLSGRTHRVITGFTLLDTSSGRILTQTVKTEVTFRKLSAGAIDAYVATGEPLDKDGAYAIQGVGAVLVKEIRGDYFNVTGLPLSALAAALKKFGVDVLSLK